MNVFNDIKTFTFTDEDGSFDILRYTDPDLDLGTDDKTIFDDLVEDSKPQDGSQKKVESTKEETIVKEEKIKQEGEGNMSILGSTEIQTYSVESPVLIF